MNRPYGMKWGKQAIRAADARKSGFLKAPLFNAHKAQHLMALIRTLACFQAR